MNSNQTGADTHDTSLRALAYELKHPLVRISREAELQQPDISLVHTQAQQALRLIDSFLLQAQAEYGQVPLALEPISVGSVLYDASIQLRELADQYNMTFVIQDRTTGLAMSHRNALQSIMYSFGSILMERSDTSHHQTVLLRGFRIKKNRLAVGMFTKQALSIDDIERGRLLQGKAHMPLAQRSSMTHVSIAIADGLSQAIGGTLHVKRMRGLHGLVAELPQSEQLAMI